MRRHLVNAHLLDQELHRGKPTVVDMSVRVTGEALAVAHFGSGVNRPNARATDRNRGQTRRIGRGRLDRVLWARHPYWPLSQGSASPSTRVKSGWIAGNAADGSRAQLSGDRTSSLRRKCPVSKATCPLVTGIVERTRTGPVRDLSKR